MKLYLVKNQQTGKLDLVKPDTLTPIHTGFESIVDAKKKLQETGHDVRAGTVFTSPYLGRYREVEYQ